MLLLLAQLLMMKIRVGNGWTVVCSKKRQNTKNLNGKNDFGKRVFLISGKEKRSEKEGKREEFCKESKDVKEANFKKTEVCAVSQSCRVKRRLLFLLFLQVPNQ